MIDLGLDEISQRVTEARSGTNKGTETPDDENDYLLCQWPVLHVQSTISLVGILEVKTTRGSLGLSDG